MRLSAKQTRIVRILKVTHQRAAPGAKIDSLEIALLNDWLRNSGVGYLELQKGGHSGHPSSLKFNCHNSLMPPRRTWHGDTIGKSSAVKFAGSVSGV